MYIPKTQMTLVLVGKGMFQRVGSARSLKIWQFDETWNLLKFCKRVQKNEETYAMYLLYLADKKAAENLARRDFTFTISDKDLFAFPASFTLFLRKLVFTLPLPPRKQIQFMPYPWDPCGYMLNHWKVCGMDSNRSLAFNIWPPWWSSLPAAGRCEFASASHCSWLAPCAEPVKQCLWFRTLCASCQPCRCCPFSFISMFPGL